METLHESQNQPPIPTELTVKPKKPAIRNWAILILIMFVLFFTGYQLGQNKIAFEDGKLEINKGPSRSADYNLLWSALDLLNSKYVDRQSLDQEKLLYGAVKGMMAAAGDPYTTFFDPEEAKEFSNELKGAIEGIGLELGTKDGQIIVIAPLEDTPASRAGLLPGDFIIAIDGESTANMSMDTAVSKIRGKAGTQVVLMILHKDSNEPSEVKIIRDKITIKSVKLESKNIDGKKIAVIRLSRFGDDTQGLFSHVVDVITGGSYDGIILDMRSNPGGYLETAVALASNWVENDKVVLKEVNYEGKVKDYNAKGLSRFAGMKTVVLVNGGSASAAEILAGALQDYGLATLVGQKTFGKGSVQELSDLQNDSTAKITIAKWHTPKDRSIDKNGLEPDIVVDRTSADVEADRDPQMDKALEQFK